MAAITDDMRWEVVNVPITKGANLNSRNRLIDPGELAKAENVYYAKSGGPEKRRGHSAVRLYDSFIPYVSCSLTDNLYGYGMFDPDNLPTGDCVYPHCGPIKDIISYNDIELAWDGWRLFEPISTVSGASKVINATIPVVRTEAVAKISGAQSIADSADNGVIRVVAYINTTSGTNEAYAKIYDSSTGTLKFTQHLVQGTHPVYLRTVSCGDYCHVLVSDSVDLVVYDYAIHNTASEVTSTTSPVQCAAAGVFDVWKFDETRFLVAAIDSNTKVSWVKANGTVNIDYIAQNFVVNLTGAEANLAVCVHPVTREMAFLWDTGLLQGFMRLTETGQSTGGFVTLSALAATVQHLAIAPSYVDNKYNLFLDNNDIGTDRYIQHYLYENDTEVSSNKRYNVCLASRACRVGNIPFVWAINVSVHSTGVYQTTYFLLDNLLLPVANVEYGTAVYSGTTTTSLPKWLPSINSVQDTTGSWATTRFNGALLYNGRIDFNIAETGVTGTTYTDPGIKIYTINFLPDKLSYTVAGGCVYIAAGQMWAYDGDTLVDAQFPLGPERPSVLTANSTGLLTNSGIYRWRVDLCRRNTKGEEIRSVSFLTDEVVMGAADDTADVIIYHPITRCTDSYYLVFRNESTGTLWYLTSDRNPENAPQYSTSAAKVTYVDLVADAALIAKEQHPANTPNYLQPIAAPACDLVTYGQDRLWISGGELAPGEIWPSRLFYPGQVPAFNWALGLRIDTSAEPITGLAFQTDYGVVFKYGITYIVTGRVSPNIYQPVQPDVQLALADRGCINHKSIVNLYNSIAFQSENGYKSLAASGQMQDIGFPVESSAGTCIGSVLAKVDEHVRFYQSDAPTLVYDYRRQLWTTFVFNTKPSAAAYSNRTKKAVIAVGNRLLYEDDAVYTDGDFEFDYLIKTAPLARQIGGFQRVRRVYCIGEKEGTPPPVTIRIYLDGHDWWSEQVVWDYADNLNTNTIGTGLIGDNFIGDTSSSEFRDDIWKFRKRLSRQKCENVAIELTDKGKNKASRWIPVAFGLQIGTKSGIDRLADRTINNQ